MATLFLVAKDDGTHLVLVAKGSEQRTFGVVQFILL